MARTALGSPASRRTFDPRPEAPSVRLATLEAATRDASRYVDLALVLRRRKTGEVLLAAGGRWDRIAGRFLTEPPPTAKIIDLEESQVEFVRWFAGFIADLREGRPRDISLALAAGDRRAGKTFALLIATVALLIDVPAIDGSATVGWLVSSSYQDRDELDKTIAEFIPPACYIARKAPQYSYSFIHGSALKNVSADDPESLRRGRSDVVLFNECQRLPLAALVNGIFGTADKGGASLLAANPPRRQVGEWVLHLKTAIEAKRILGAKFFPFSSKDNERIDTAARERVAEIVKVLDPRAAKADDEGAWLPVGELAYPKWDSRPIADGGMVGEPPEDLEDITRQALKDAEIHSKTFTLVAGCDFQGRPHHAAVVFRVFKRPEDGSLIYWAIDELLAEGTERHLSGRLFNEGYTPETLCLIGDASGEWQDGKHSNRETSFDILKSDRWKVYPPTEIKRPESTYAANPRVERRLSMAYQVMDERRFFVHPKCEWLIESLEKCPLKPARYGGRKPYGKHSHVSDAAFYSVWKIEPKAKPYRRPLRREDVASFPDLRPGYHIRNRWDP